MARGSSRGQWNPPAGLGAQHGSVWHAAPRSASHHSASRLTARLSDSLVTAGLARSLQWPHSMPSYMSSFHHDASCLLTIHALCCHHAHTSSMALGPPNPAWRVLSWLASQHMFDGAFAFNQPVNNWGVWRVTNMEVCQRTAHCFSHDLPIVSLQQAGW